MKQFAIVDRNIGVLQYICYAENELEALEKFDNDVGVYTDDQELNVDEWKIFEVNDKQAEYLQNWSDNGCPAIDAPDCIPLD